MTNKELEQKIEEELHAIRTPIKAIRTKCLDCSGGSANEIKLCVIPSCPLYPFRLGKNPFRTPMSEERKEIYRQRIKELQASGKMTRKKQK